MYLTIMTKGKSICNVLKTIRKQVADANEIKYEPRECHHEGECRGTCPACEAEVRYIEQQLNIRRQLGKAVVVMGISAGLAGLTSCTNCTNIINRPYEGYVATDSLWMEDMESTNGATPVDANIDSIDSIEKVPSSIQAPSVSE